MPKKHFLATDAGHGAILTICGLLTHDTAAATDDIELVGCPKCLWHLKNKGQGPKIDLRKVFEEKVRPLVTPEEAEAMERAIEAAAEVPPINLRFRRRDGGSSSSSGGGSGDGGCDNSSYDTGFHSSSSSWDTNPTTGLPSTCGCGSSDVGGHSWGSSGGSDWGL